MTMPNSPMPSSFPIPCSRKRLQTSCASIPPICSLITRSASTCSRLSRAVRGNCASTLNSSTWPPHFTISALSRSSRAQTNASRSMAQTPLDSFSTPTTFLKIRCRPSGKQSRCTPPPASQSICVPKWRCSIQVFCLDVIGVGFDQFPVEGARGNRRQLPANKFQRGLYSGVFRRLCAQARRRRTAPSTPPSANVSCRGSRAPMLAT